MPLLGKEDAARYIGVSVRTLQRLHSRGEIPRLEESGPKGKEARFDTNDLDRYLEQHKPQALFRPGAQLPAPRQDAPAVASLVAAIAQSIQPARSEPAQAASLASTRLLLSLSDARALTGLSERHLRDAIHSGKLKGKIVGRGYKMLRADLESYLKKLMR
jgi:excisionase family DNA binding protein